VYVGVYVVGHVEVDHVLAGVSEREFRRKISRKRF
jgi:hypothetical protein